MAAIKKAKKAQFGEYLSVPDKEGKSTLTTKLNTAAGPRYYQARGFDEGNLRNRNQFRARTEAADSTKAASIDPSIIKRLSQQKNGGKTAKATKAKDGKWMQKAAASIKRRGTEGKCTPITKPGCTGRAKALAKTFKKIAAKRKAK